MHHLALRKSLLLELVAKMPAAVTYLFTRSPFFVPLRSMWDSLHRNSVFFAWNILLGGNQTNATNASSSSPRPTRNGEAAVEVMHALDQFILSQHRSMKILQGGAISFLENQMIDAEAGNHDHVDAAADTVPRKSTRHPRNKTTIVADFIRQQKSSLGKKRSLLQMDDSIRAYSSIVAATKEYSRISIARSPVTDTWLQGPLQWPPR